MKEAERRDETKRFGMQSAAGLLKWLFEGRVVRTINGAPPDKNGDARVAGADVDVSTLSDPEVRRILGGWEEGELDDGWNARAANKLATARQIALSGDVSGDAMFDGSEDVVIGTAVECLTTTEIDDLMAQSMAIGG